MVGKDSEAYSMSEGAYVFLVLLPFLVFCYQLFFKHAH